MPGGIYEPIGPGSGSGGGSSGPPFPPAGSNLNFYVATTGNDSNPGTSGSPFATIQHAVNVAEGFDYTNQYLPTINVAAGTYNESVILGPLINIPGDTDGAVLSGAGASTTTIYAGSDFALTVGLSRAAQWSIKNITMDSSDTCINVQGGTLTSRNIGVQDSSNGGNCLLIEIQTNGQMYTGDGLTIGGTTAANFLNLNLNAGMVVNPGTTITFPASYTFTNAVIDMFQVALLQFTPTSIVNSGGVTGPQLFAEQLSCIITNNGLVSDIPGTVAPVGDGDVDLTSSIASFATFQANIFFQTNAGIPDSSIIPPTTWGVWKDTSGGGLYLIANDAGVMKALELAALSFNYLAENGTDLYVAENGTDQYVTE